MNEMFVYQSRVESYNELLKEAKAERMIKMIKKSSKIKSNNKYHSVIAVYNFFHRKKKDNNIAMPYNRNSIQV
jgi:uncharacterized protein YbjQ (UPF0145 family)